ncbi:MAG: LysM peptidoglycan-binding domain-containing protein, partial [Odoribacter sp.]|nr:LysM peptidoglycan-binding domain-containing protein [Odoribacter sp.]
MLRWIFVICLAWLCLEVSGQEVTRSTDIVVLRGKSYYLHTVLSGQTLFSICKFYGTSVEEVKALNGKKDDVLSLYEVLRIPYVETPVQQDEKYYYHRVQKGETLYSIARLYHIAPKKLLKLNSEYENQPLSVGAVVKLPLNEIVLQESGDAKAGVAEKSVAETGKRSVRKQEQKMESVRPVEEKVVSDTLPIPAYEESRNEGMWIAEVPVPTDAFVKIALLLPFSAGDYPLYDDTVKFQPMSLSARSEMFVGFYEGILLAVDSLKSLGYRVDLHVFDTERKSENVYGISEEINRLQPDLVIGPVYASTYRVMAGQLSSKNIPLVYPCL